MKKLPIGLAVHVQGHANQFPHEEINDQGIILDNTRGYLVQLKHGRENLIFKRRELTPLEPLDTKPRTALPKRKKDKVHPFDPFDL